MIDKDIDVSEVLSLEQKEFSGGGCETCWFEYIEVHIKFISKTGCEDVFKYYGGMAKLVESLVQY